MGNILPHSNTIKQLDSLKTYKLLPKEQKFMDILGMILSYFAKVMKSHLGMRAKTLLRVEQEMMQLMVVRESIQLFIKIHHLLIL